jgi:leader peptidase (prepilin peptidase)/N-methyltransferase
MTAGADLAAEIFLIACAVLLGLSLGSFATALIYRIPRGISWTSAASNDNAVNRSHCTTCDAKLGALDLIPVFSWLLSHGKCRHCGSKISGAYPVIELTTMLLTLILWWVWGFSLMSAPILLAVPFFVAAVVIDWKHMILPDDINISLSILGGLYVLVSWGEAGWDVGILLNAILSAILLFGLLYTVSFLLSKWKGRAALGRGDLKFLPAAGLFLGIAALPTYLALSGALGVLTALLKRKNNENPAFPFGPALVISLYIHVFLTGLGFDYTW